jgi:hypothetical protein
LIWQKGCRAEIARMNRNSPAQRDLPDSRAVRSREKSAKGRMDAQRRLGGCQRTGNWKERLVRRTIEMESSSTCERLKLAATSVRRPVMPVDGLLDIKDPLSVATGRNRVFRLLNPNLRLRCLMIRRD